MVRSIDGIVFGRVAHEKLAQYWPTAASQPERHPLECTCAES